MHDLDLVLSGGQRPDACHAVGILNALIHESGLPFAVRKPEGALYLNSSALCVISSRKLFLCRDGVKWNIDVKRCSPTATRLFCHTSQVLIHIEDLE